MTVKTLYKYQRANGKWTVSPVEPPVGVEVIILNRLIADEGMVLTKDGGLTYCSCVDVNPEDIEDWDEIEEPEPEE